MRRRVLLLLPLLVMTAACSVQQDRPTLQVAALAAKAETPLDQIDRVQAVTCEYGRQTLFLWGSDKHGRPLVATVRQTVFGYLYLDELPWERAVALVRASGYQPVEQPPQVTTPKGHAWLVVVQRPDLSLGHVLVDLSTGATKVEAGDQCTPK